MRKWVCYAEYYSFRNNIFRILTIKLWDRCGRAAAEQNNVSVTRASLPAGVRSPPT